jgi:hypothetical protein
MAKWDYIRLSKHHHKHLKNVMAGWRSEDAYKEGDVCTWDSGRKHDVCAKIPKAIYIFLLYKEERRVANADILAAVGDLIPVGGKPKIDKINDYLRELAKQKIIKSVELH